LGKTVTIGDSQSKGAGQTAAHLYAVHAAGSGAAMPAAQAGAGQRDCFQPLIESALDAVDVFRQQLKEPGQDHNDVDADIRVVVPLADLRLTIEQGSCTAARNAIDVAKTRGSANPCVLIVDPHRAIDEACVLLSEYAHSLQAGIQGEPVAVLRQRQARALAAVKNLLMIERLL
jgi:hypothetical protein